MTTYSRISPSQPNASSSSQPTPASQPKAAQPKAVRQSAAAAALTPSPKYLPDGAKAQCQVLLKSAKQCSNPLNFHWHGHGTCHTHLNRLMGMTPKQAAAVRFTDRLAAYDTTLWGAPKAAPKAASQPKAAKAAKAAPQPQPKAAGAKAAAPKAAAASQPASPAVAAPSSSQQPA